MGTSPLAGLIERLEEGPFLLRRLGLITQQALKSGSLARGL